MDIDQLFLRNAIDADVEVVTACVHNAFRHYIERIGRKPGPMLMDYEFEIREYRVWIAGSRDGITAGVVVLHVTDEGFLLDVIAVEPGYQGKGVGKLLLEFSEAEALRHGYDSIYLFTHEKMTENQVLYKKIGYVEYDRRVEHGLRRIYMRKQLK